MILVSLTQHYFGSFEVEVSASDGLESVFTTFILDVTAINDAPYFSHLGDILINEDNSYSEPWAYNISAGAYNEH